jgi:hypothetical protein
VSPRSPRAWPVALSGAGALALAIGVVLAFATREEAAPVPALITLAVGNALVVAGSGWMVRHERAADGLVVPGERQLPTPAWWHPIGLTGLVDIAAAPAVSGWLGLFGLLLVSASAVAAGEVLLRPPAADLDRGVVRAARKLRTVAVDAGPAVGALEPVGRSGVRVVAIGPDGQWADVVLSGVERAQSAAALAGLELRDQTDPSFGGAFG